MASSNKSLMALRKLLKRPPKATPSAPNTSKGFLSLPGELRNEIYEYLIFPHLQHIMIVGNSNSRCFGDSILQHPIFRMNRQVRAEALSFLCANKQFLIYGINAASRFFNYIGPAGRQSMANVVLGLMSHQDCPNYQPLLGFLGEMRSLKNFHLRIDKDDWYAWGEVDGKVFLKQLQEAVNGEEGPIMTWQVVGTTHLRSEEGAILVTTREIEQILGQESHRYQ